MSIRAIYSLRIFCDGDSYGKTDNATFGFYADDITQTNPVIIGWSESLLAPDTDGTTTIDGLLARSYAPIILSVSVLNQTFDIDSPVINNSGISITISNHEKCLAYIKSQGIELVGLKVRLSTNYYNESGTLTRTKFEFYGEIQTLQMNETDIVISCNNNKFSKESNLLNTGEIITIGELTESDSSYVNVIRNENFKTLWDNSDQTSFLVIGGYDTITSTVRKRTYQIFFKTSLPVGLDLTGYWMYVEQSGTESKGEYRKVTSVTEITNVQVDDEIAIAGLGSYMTAYDDGYYLTVEIDGAFTEGLVVDLNTYVQFFQFSHSYSLSKNVLSGTVESLYSKVDDNVVPFGQYGYSCTLNTDGTIDLNPDYPIDDDTIATYTGLPCRNLDLVGDESGTITNEENLREWIYEAPDPVSGDLYKNLHSQYCIDNNSDFAAGFFHTGAADVTDLQLLDKGSAYDRLLTFGSYAEFTNTYTCVAKSLVCIQFDLPAIADDFKFKSVHLGLAIKSTCTNGLATPTGIACITKQAYGTAKKHFNAPLSHVSGSAYINTIPEFYLTQPIDEDYFYDTDWQWKTDDASPQTRFTCLELTKLQDVDTVEKYRKILKVGLFFLRDGGTTISDNIKIYEIAAIFKHENSLTEVLI